MTDAVVIGSGPNGLVAANLLASEGWTVTVLEAQATYGGAVRTDGDLSPGFRQDTFSAFYPFAAASPVICDLHLEEHGLVWEHAPAVLGNPLPDGSWAVLHRRPEDTAAGFEALSPGDGAAWLELYKDWKGYGLDLVHALLSPFPPVRTGAKAAAALVRAGGLPALVMPLLPVRRLAESRFGGEAPRVLLTGNALHADFAPETVGSGVFGLTMTMLGQQLGFPVPRGGAGELAAALVRRLESLGGTVQTGAEVVSIVVCGDRAVAVRLADGTAVDATKAVVATVTAPALYGGLVDWEDLPRRTRLGMGRFTWDPGTVKVDWALSGPAPWDPAPAVAPGTVHIANSVDELSTYTTQIRHGLVPSDPFLLMGQMTTTDATRSPAGTESMWAYCHVPQRVRGDAGNDSLTGRWDESELETFADRMQARIEHFAPGFGNQIIARRVLGPHELETRNANLRGGAINGGTARLGQALFLRPVPGLGRAETPIKRLYLGSASAHPGGGVHGAPGANAARAALVHDRGIAPIPLLRPPWLPARLWS